VYQAFIPHIEKWLVTQVPLTVAGADTFIPVNYLDGFVPAETKDLGDGLSVVTYARASAAEAA
jgi:hypothetical protein